MNWHRLFGIMLTDVFTNSPYEVELEKDLSHKQQFLDVVIIRKKPGTFQGRLPDGLDNLADHNLVSFKSHQQTFDAWTVNELIGHYVNYRKQLSTGNEPILPENHFRLYGICARFPAQLAGKVALNELQPGVLECNLGVVTIRLLVVRDLSDDEHNAPLHLFSADRNKVQYGREHFQLRSPTTSTLLKRLIGQYEREGLNMPYTIEDFKREALEETLNEIPVEEILERIPVEKRLEGLSVEEIEAYLKKLKNAPRKSDETEQGNG